MSERERERERADFNADRWQWNERLQGYGVDYLLNGAQGARLDAFPEGTRTRSGIFRAFSVDGNVVVSDIAIQVGNVPLSDQQRKFYGDLLLYSETYQGPVQSEQQRVAAAPLQREQTRARNKPLLFAPPILVQWRNKVAACGGFSEAILQRQVELGSKQCNGTYQCLKDGAKLENPVQVRACAGEPQGDTPHFGLLPRDFRGDATFSDFLSSLDAPIVVRDGVTGSATDFLDLLTTRTLVMMAIFTPEIPAASVLQIDISLDGIVPDVSWSVEHLTIVEGKALEDVRIAFVFVYVCIGCSVLMTIIIGAFAFIRRNDGVLGDGIGNPVHGHSRRDQLAICVLDLILIVITAGVWVGGNGVLRW